MLTQLTRGDEYDILFFNMKDKNLVSEKLNTVNSDSKKKNLKVSASNYKNKSCKCSGGIADTCLH